MQLLILVELDIFVNMAERCMLFSVQAPLWPLASHSSSVSWSHHTRTSRFPYILFEGTKVLKEKGVLDNYYFYSLPAPVFFLLPSFHAAVEHLRKTCLPLSKFPTNVNWASGKRKCESWGHSWNQTLAWLHIILLLCFKGDLEKSSIYFPQRA